jgi:hypothetical protein
MSAEGIATKAGEVALGLLFTLAGLASLLIPQVPFICIGALIFGPIMLVHGLLASGAGRRSPRSYGPPLEFSTIPTAGMTTPGAPDETVMCRSCGRVFPSRLPSGEALRFCANCGAVLG